MRKNSLRTWEMSLLIALCICLCQAAVQSSRQAALSQKLLRMHIVAASDSAEDQTLKLKVRDAVSPLLEAALEGCSDLEEAEWRIEASRGIILAAARDAADGEKVEMCLGREMFAL